MNPRRCIINFARAGWYPGGQGRLFKSMKDRTDASFLPNGHEASVGQPTHQEIPYAFKLGCFQRAVDLGYDTVLWCDASVYAVGDLELVFRHVEKHGHLFVGAGKEHPIGRWTNDATLDAFGVQRDDVMDVEQQSTILVGLDLTRQDMRQWLHTWTTHRAYFKGAWDNDKQTESKDSRCSGHRHDQSVAALVTHQMGLEVLPRDNHLFAYADGDLSKNPVLLAQGM